MTEADDAGSETRVAEALRAMFLQDVGLALRGKGGAAPADAATRFGQIAIERGLVTADQLQEALQAQQRQPGARIGELLQGQGRLSLRQLVDLLQVQRERRHSDIKPVGRYFLLEELGRGASGRVYRAIHQDLLKTVAVKVIEETADLPRVVLDRFRREATTAARLRHPGIVGVHDVGTEGAFHYIAMDFIEGQTLRAWMKDPARGLAERVGLLRKVAEAVAHAHREGVLHRDLKPENVIVRPDGEPVLVDFGLARVTTDVGLTREGAVMGTPIYMAPEQVRGDVRSIDARTDVYALGVILYEAATGRLPFNGETVADVYDQILRNDAVPPTRVKPGLPRELDIICGRCLDKEPPWRYGSAADLATDLAKLAAGDPISRTRFATAIQYWRRVRRHPVVIAAVLALVIGGAAAWRWRKGELEARAPGERARAIQAAVLDPGRRATGDPTGTAEAFRARTAFASGAAGGEEILDEARRRHPDNPILPLAAAMRRIEGYTRAVEWPEGLMSINPFESEFLSSPPVETEEMKSWLPEARRDLDAARRAPVWSLFGDLQLRWILVVADGADRFASDDVDGAVERFGRLGDDDLRTAAALFGDLRAMAASWSGRRFRTELRRAGRDPARCVELGRSALKSWDAAVLAEAGDPRRLISRGRIKLEMAVVDEVRKRETWLRESIDDFEDSLRKGTSAEGFVCRAHACAVMAGELHARGGSTGNVLSYVNAVLESGAAAIEADPACVEARIVRAKVAFAFDSIVGRGIADVATDYAEARRLAPDRAAMDRRIEAVYGPYARAMTEELRRKPGEARFRVVRAKCRLLLGDAAGAREDVKILHSTSGLEPSLLRQVEALDALLTREF